MARINVCIWQVEQCFLALSSVGDAWHLGKNFQYAGVKRDNGVAYD